MDGLRNASVIHESQDLNLENPVQVAQYLQNEFAQMDILSLNVEAFKVKMKELPICNSLTKLKLDRSLLTPEILDLTSKLSGFKSIKLVRTKEENVWNVSFEGRKLDNTLELYSSADHYCR